MGLRSSHMSELFLSDCEIPSDALLGSEGAGMVIFNHSMRWERSLILAPAVGTMQRQLERCVRYAREREQFGSPIGKFQAISHPIADMKLRLETSHLMLQRIAGLLDGGRGHRPGCGDDQAAHQRGAGPVEPGDACRSTAGPAT